MTLHTRDTSTPQAPARFPAEAIDAVSISSFTRGRRVFARVFLLRRGFRRVGLRFGLVAK